MASNSGAVDLLITESDTYLLTGPHDAPTQCRALGRRLHVPPVQWLSEKAACVGETRLTKKPVQLWKTPGVDGQATWHWITPDTRLPWRSLFLSRALDPAIIGDYAMTYFPTFTPWPDANLSALRNLCRAQARPGGADALPAAQTARELMAIGNPAAEAERQNRIDALIPGLNHEACARMPTVRWPDRFIMTATIVPIRFDEDPYLALIYYDWSDAGTQLALMLQGRHPTLKGLISLKDKVGYRFRSLRSGGAVCDVVFPGMVRPDWMTVAGCRCKGVIDRNAALSPEGETQILSCPIKHKGQRIMWNWYTTLGTPIVFVEAGASGGGVMLADYHDWVPGQTGKPEDFALPKICKPTAPSIWPTPSGQSTTYSSPSCSDCHTTPW